MSSLKNERGFTFLEISIVVAVIGILMLVALPNYQKATERAQEKSCLANQNMIETQVQNHYIDQGSYASDLDTLVSTGYLKEKPKCPSNGSYAITVPTETSSTLSITCSKHPR